MPEDGAKSKGINKTRKYCNSNQTRQKLVNHDVEAIMQPAILPKLLFNDLAEFRVHQKYNCIKRKYSIQ